MYNVPESTLRSRLAGVTSRRDYQPKLKKLTEPKEEVIIRYVLDLDSREFPPTINAIRLIANKLLAKRGAKLVSTR